MICGLISAIEAFYQYLDYHELDNYKLTYFRWALWLLYIVLVLVFLPLVVGTYTMRYFRGGLDWLVGETRTVREEEGVELEDMGSLA